MASAEYKHWNWSQDAQRIVWLTFDRDQASANTINLEVLGELNSIIEHLRNVINPAGLVIKSGKNSGFIAGADISEFKTNDPGMVQRIINFGHVVFDKLSELTFPTLALVDGFCLGGGFELALACKYIVAIDSEKTKLGLPEILLGIQPGWGGTVRLPQRIGVLKAMELILSGKTLSARAAAKIGMIDAAIQQRHITAAVDYYLFTKPVIKTMGRLEKFFHLDFVRPLVGKVLKHKLEQKVTQKHYPAPYAIVDNWVNYSVTSQEALQQEANSICKLAETATAKNLIRIFFLRERLKRAAKQAIFRANWVHVIGAGVMGGDIAAWCAASGIKVTLEDTNIDAVAKSLARAKDLFIKKFKYKHLIQAAQDRLQPDLIGAGRKSADVIIEAIVENVTAKQQLFTVLEQQARPETILATNTSTIPLEKIGDVMIKPERLVGIHFFNPVAKMQLVEVIAAEKTEVNVHAQALAFVSQLDKLPLTVKSAPGFLVNRMLIPYLLESITLLEEGIPAAVIDKAAVEFGMPLGPLELVDTIGLDICANAAESLNMAVPEIVQQRIKHGQLGRKSGQGFYRYTQSGKVIKVKAEQTSNIPVDTADRLVMRIINEGMAVLREGVVADPELIDAGMIFGAGFAPFSGGPMCYVHDNKPEVIQHRLAQLAERYGVRFTADPGWALPCN